MSSNRTSAPDVERSPAARPSSNSGNIAELADVGRIRRWSPSAKQIGIARLVDLEVDSTTPLHALPHLPEEQRAQLILKTAADIHQWLLYLKQGASVMADEVIQEARVLTPIEIDSVSKTPRNAEL